MKYKRLNRVTICSAVLISLLMLTGVLAKSIYFSGRDGEIVEVPSEPGNLEGEYVLRSYEGCICVFESGEDNPVIRTDITLEALRETDQALLESGITVDSYEKLIRILEDFDS